MTADEPPRRRGRPRLKPSTSDVVPSDEILAAAARLFAELGYENTSFTAIANAVGMQRASLYHHFPNKDALLLEIGRPWMTPLVELIEQFDRDNEPRDLQFYRYLRIDMRHIGTAPYDLVRLYQFPDIHDRAGLEPFWSNIDAIHTAWVRWIGSAVEGGTLRQIDPELAGSLAEAAYIGVIAGERPSLKADLSRTGDGFADPIPHEILNADPA